MKTMKQKILLCKQEIKKNVLSTKIKKKIRFQQLTACSSQERGFLSYPYIYNHMQVLWLYQFLG